MFYINLGPKSLVLNGQKLVSGIRHFPSVFEGTLPREVMPTRKPGPGLNIHIYVFSI